MALSLSIELFVDRWIQKAESIQLNQNDLASYFDKFFTLFVVYNRLYMEATFQMWRDCEKYKLKPPPTGNFPDTNAATTNISKFLTPRSIIQSLSSDTNTNEAINNLIDILQEGSFFVRLKTPKMEGDRTPKMEGDRQADEELLKKMTSPYEKKKAEAILEFIHSIRCNTFHGSKGYSPDQIKVLAPCIKILEKLIPMLREKLMAEERF